MVCQSYGGYADNALTDLGNGTFRVGDETSPDYPDHLDRNILGMFDENGEFQHNPMGQPIPRRYLGTLTFKF